MPGRRVDEVLKLFAHELSTAERGRGLLMVEALATRWGAYPVVPFPFCAGLGTAVWAEFAKVGA